MCSTSKLGAYPVPPVGSNTNGTGGHFHSRRALRPSRSLKDLRNRIQSVAERHWIVPATPIARGNHPPPTASRSSGPSRTPQAMPPGIDVPIQARAKVLHLGAYLRRAGYRGVAVHAGGCGFCGSGSRLPRPCLLGSHPGYSILGHGVLGLAEPELPPAMFPVGRYGPGCDPSLQLGRSQASCDAGFLELELQSANRGV